MPGYSPHSLHFPRYIVPLYPSAVTIKFFWNVRALFFKFTFRDEKVSLLLSQLLTAGSDPVLQAPGPF
jgi:hypothetical protein